ncbi:pentatricopeptide repeat-containing protein At3g42630 [Cicer arietinum]|uniref:Pentatricopeptide repeat-containing protein At3g42630 n=1 Tax=Cicer arietinum TaxID=3827 RepID=A0A1S2XIF8_CICAR|nr:pentatricopeptide repeat-containing protein At3g42630 [Cicer arietinum]
MEILSLGRSSPPNKIPPILHKHSPTSSPQLLPHNNTPISLRSPNTSLVQHAPILHKHYSTTKKLLSHHSSLMLYYAENNLIHQSQSTWEQLLNSSFIPSLHFISKLFKTYSKHSQFDLILYILNSLKSRYFNLLPHFYSLAISSFGNAGNLHLMEQTATEMVSNGFHIDSKTGNYLIRCYAVFGSLNQMENTYGRLKRSRFSIDGETIRAVAFAYLKKRKFYELGEFVRDVGLGRRNLGNLLWNLLLLSYAANFKMKSLQREFVRMVQAGFRPDLTSFNIRVLAFSRMDLFWDLHLSIEHMRDEMVVPDLVTYGCVVDGYLDRKLGRNLEFVLNKMSVDDCPRLLTDPFVFEVLGKGDFHLSSEAFLEYETGQNWSYRVLIKKYLKKHYRRNQIFWNY